MLDVSTLLKEYGVDPFIVRRGRSGAFREVVHRETGRKLGHVGQHFGGSDLDGFWSARSPHDNDACGDVKRTMREAALELLDAYNLRPVVRLRVCSSCNSTIPRPNLCLTGRCETREQAESRSRADPELAPAWEHYDWISTLDLG